MIGFLRDNRKYKNPNKRYINAYEFETVRIDVVVFAKASWYDLKEEIMSGAALFITDCFT